MNAEIAKKWVAALRSGEYKQCRGRLQRTDDQPGVTGFCCLGVLCDLYAQETKTGHWRASTEIAGVVFDTGVQYVDTPSAGSAWSGTVLPLPVQRWAAMRDAGGLVCGAGGTTTALAEMNDEGQSFEQIADYIETHVGFL